MDITTVARQLLDNIAAPRGAVTVVPVRAADNSWLLKVWVRNGRIPTNVPTVFQGFSVQIEDQPQASADGYHHAFRILAD